VSVLLFVVGVVVVVLVIALAYDIRARRRGRTSAGPGVSAASRRTKLDSQARASEWGAGGS
jgi:putative copper export protein